MTVGEEPLSASDRPPVSRPDMSGTGSETREFLREPTEDGWERFVERYARRIHRWCSKRLFRDDEAEDLLQEIWLKLYQSLETFDYRKTSRFRYWLSHVKQSVWADFLARHHQRNILSRTSDLESVEAKDGSDVAGLLEILDLVSTAEGHVRERVGEIRWNVYRLRIHQGKSAREAAFELNLTPATVDNYFSAVRAEVEKEIEKMITVAQKPLRTEKGDQP